MGCRFALEIDNYVRATSSSGICCKPYWFDKFSYLWRAWSQIDQWKWRWCQDCIASGKCCLLKVQQISPCLWSSLNRARLNSLQQLWEILSWTTLSYAFDRNTELLQNTQRRSHRLLHMPTNQQGIHSFRCCWLVSHILTAFEPLLGLELFTAEGSIETFWYFNNYK